jgi:hypothetical protein
MTERRKRGHELATKWADPWKTLYRAPILATVLYIVDRLGFVFGDLFETISTTNNSVNDTHSRNFPRNPQNPNVVRSFSLEKFGFSTGTAVESSLMILKTNTARTQDFCTTEIRYATRQRLGYCATDIISNASQVML